MVVGHPVTDVTPLDAPPFALVPPHPPPWAAALRQPFDSCPAPS